MRLFLVYSLMPLLLWVAQTSATPKDIQEVTRSDFQAFVNATGYVTDAEQYGWTFRQRTVYAYQVSKGESWRNSTYRGHEATQVSYRDAVAYCQWKGARLPTLSEYWQLATEDQQRDVWDWTQEGILAGGSYLCELTTCAGFLAGNEKRDVSRDTSNSHIGFCIIIE